MTTDNNTQAKLYEMRSTLLQMLADWNSLSEEERDEALLLADLKATERLAHELKFSLLKSVRRVQVGS